MLMTNEYVRATLKNMKDVKGMEWEDIAEKADVSVSTLYKFVYNQTGSMKLETVSRVLDALGMEMVIRPKEDKQTC